MPVFYVYDVRQGNVTPLNRQFKVYKTTETTKLSDDNLVHKQTDSGRHNADQQQAAKYYQQNLSDKYNGLGLVKDIMTSPVLTIQKNESLSSAWVVMQQHMIHHLVIVDKQNKYCGMLSEKTILPYTMAHTGTHPDDMPLSLFCQETLLATHPDTLISDLARALLEYGLDSIAVTNHDEGKESLVGVVTYSDILKIILKSKGIGIEA